MLGFLISRDTQQVRLLTRPFGGGFRPRKRRIVPHVRRTGAQVEWGARQHRRLLSHGHQRQLRPDLTNDDIASEALDFAPRPTWKPTSPTSNPTCTSPQKIEFEKAQSCGIRLRAPETKKFYSANSATKSKTSTKKSSCLTKPCLVTQELERIR